MRIFILLIGILFGMFQFSPPVRAQEKAVVGWLEKVRIYPGDLLIHAKLDSGAKNSSLDAAKLVEFIRDSEPWVRFNLTTRDGRRVTLERKVKRQATVKRKGAASQKRPVIMLGICLGDYYKEVEVNLVDRSSFLYPMLIGRSFMAGSLIIDPAVKFTTNPSCKEALQP